MDLGPTSYSALYLMETDFTNCIVFSALVDHIAFFGLSLRAYFYFIL